MRKLHRPTSTSTSRTRQALHDRLCWRPSSPPGLLPGLTHPDVHSAASAPLMECPSQWGSVPRLKPHLAPWWDWLSPPTSRTAAEGGESTDLMCLSLPVPPLCHLNTCFLPPFGVTGSN